MSVHSRPAAKNLDAVRIELGAVSARPPPHARGMKIGLLGGSFNPPHAGHRAISLMAMKRLGLDRIWWLVTPGNPLKDAGTLLPLDQRIAEARKTASHPRIDVTGLEAGIGTRYTFHTLRWLKLRCPGVHFVWIMGADNLAGFHRWRNWRDIADLVPIAVIDRANASRAAASPLAHRLAAHRLPEALAPRLALSDPPAFVFLHGLKCSVSSTALRQS